MLKNVIIVITDIATDIGYYAEELSGGLVCFIFMNVIDWQYEIIKFTMGIAASITSAYLVHKIKNKFWENGKKNKNP